MRRKALSWALAIGLATAAGAFAVEDGLGTNHVRTLKAYDGIVLNDQKITTWTEVSSSTLTNSSIATAMIQDDAVTADKIAAAVAGDGLVGADGSALAVGAGDGISVSANAVAVDASVIRTNGAQSMAGVKTFTDSPIVPTPTTDMQAATKLYVDGKVGSSIASGTADSQTLRWNGAGWTNTAGLLVDADGDAAVAASLKVTGVQTNVSDLVVQGKADVAGSLKVTGAQTNVASLAVQGNVVLGDAASDTVTFTAKAASDLSMDNTYKVTGLADPSAARDAANKQYVDSAINGLSWKQSVRAASTADLNLGVTLDGVAVDGVTLAVDDRVLVKAQSSAIQNGIYVVNAGAPTRAPDMTNTVQLKGAAVFVASGTAASGTAWVCMSPSAAVGVNAINFTQFASPGTYSAGDGLTLSGLQFSVVPGDFTGTGLEVNGGDIRIASGAAGDGLTGGGGSALAVDASVIRTNGAQSLAGVKTFTSSPIVPTPTTDYQAATKLYVDGKLGSSVAGGTAADQMLRWNGAGWTNTAGLLVDASGNAMVIGTAVFSNTVALKNNVTIGDASSDTLTIESVMTNKAAAVFQGNVTLGDAGGDTIAFNGTAASDLNMGTTYTVTGLKAPSANGDAATKLYVDNLVNGLSWKDSVKVATTNARTFASDFENGDTVDGVALATGDRILIKNQASASQNGIYTVAASGAPARTADMDANDELGGAAVFVTHGTRNAGTAWVCTSPDAVVGAGEITFAQFASPGTYTAGHALTLTGLEFAVDPTALAGSDMEVNSGTLRLAASAAGAGLTGGAGSVLAVGQGDGITVSADAIAVDASVIRTNGAQSLAGVKTFTDSPIVPTPTTDMQAATKLYVDGKVGASIANGTAASQTLRWNGAGWTNTAGLQADASGNVLVSGALTSSGAVTVVSATQSTDKDTGALIVEGGAGIEKNLNVGGTAGVAGNVTLSATTTSTTKDTGALVVEGGVGVEENLNVGGNAGVTGNITVDGNSTLGNAGTDTLTVNAKTTFKAPVIMTTSLVHQVEAAVGISSALQTTSYLIIRSDGGAIDISANPQIAAGTPGQLLTIQGSSAADVNSVKFDDGTGLALAGGVSFTVKEGHIIQLIYDGTVWRELFRSVPAP